MKLSIAWIADHLQASWKTWNVADLVAQCNTKVAEIEHFYPITINLDLFSLAQVVKAGKDGVEVFSPEWNDSYRMPIRSDVVQGATFLITKKGWVTLQDLKSGKDGLMPALHCSTQDMQGAWKESFETEDYILELDNKSITHRPDMWGHRGFAREVGALLGIPLKPETTLLEKLSAKTYETLAAATPHFPITLELQSDRVKHFAGLYIDHVDYASCVVPLAHRLLRVDLRPLNAMVDAANYVMLDLGQPLHTFDAQKITGKKIIVRAAKAQEQLIALDNQTVTLTAQDVVIADASAPLVLAGVIGGRTSAVTEDTESLFVEAACFDATTIRRTSVRHKKRTEASARFEKSLDPQLNVTGLQRYVALLREHKIPVTIQGPIITLGHLPQPTVIDIAHHTIEVRLGTPVEPATIKKILQALEFHVSAQTVGGQPGYRVTVPSFRATKDISIKEDIIEEVGRCIGYSTIKPTLPALKTEPHDIKPQLTMRNVKKHCAAALGMHEVVTYSMYYEPWLARLGWEPAEKESLSIKNPVSEHYRRLITSLVPALLDIVHQHETKQDSVRFFEWGRVWSGNNKHGNKKHGDNKHSVEQQALACIWFDRKKPLDFYAIKAEFTSLFDLLKVPVSWRKATTPPLPWYSTTQTAELVSNGVVIGTAGMVDAAFLERVMQGYAFVAELNADFLQTYRHAQPTFNPLPKYPGVWLDVSLLVPLSLTVERVAEMIKDVDARITSVVLIDFFEKDEWVDKRSLTFRYTIIDPDKTLVHDDIAALGKNVATALQKQGAAIR